MNIIFDKHMIKGNVKQNHLHILLLGMIALNIRITLNHSIHVKMCNCKACLMTKPFLSCCSSLSKLVCMRRAVKSACGSLTKVTIELQMMKDRQMTAFQHFKTSQLNSLPYLLLYQKAVIFLHNICTQNVSSFLGSNMAKYIIII